MRRVARFVALALLTAPCVARADETATPDAYDDIRKDAALDAHGLVDLYYARNPADPPSRRNVLRAFDFRANEPSIGYARLTLAHRPHRYFGFRIDSGFGDTTDTMFRSDPASLQHPLMARWLSHFMQAFVTVDIPVGRGLRIDAGKFATPVGYEGNESVQNWNYSRGLLYDWAEPSLHSGLRATYAPSNHVSLSSFLLNGWNTNVLEGSGLRSFGFATNWKPRDTITVSLVYMGGLERDPINFANETLGFRNLFDGSVSIDAGHHLSLVLSGDYGHDTARGGVDWWGVAGFARLDATDWCDAATRVELFSDPQGYMTGIAQTVAEVTTTFDVHWISDQTRIVTRLEHRHDQSSRSVFDAASGARGTQDTFTAAVMATF